LVLLVVVSLKGGWFRFRSKELEPKPFGLTLEIGKLANICFNFYIMSIWQNDLLVEI
jgi:hypothetical protein